YSIEYSEDFVRFLTRDYPGVNFIHGDAFDIDASLGGRGGLTFDSVVSAVPLLNVPVARRVAYVEDLLSRIPAGRPIVQLTYGPRSPVPPRLGNYQIRRLDFVIRNIPPTTLWLY